MKIINYELNEVPFRVIESYVRSFPKSTLSKIYTNSNCFETITEDEGILSPWITWPTVHRGVTNSTHCISDFGQSLEDVNADYPSFDRILADNGIKVGLFGSLHSHPLPEEIEGYSFYIPDTFAKDSTCYPEQVECFQDLNLAMVDRSGRNVSTGLPKKELIAFMKQWLGLGISSRTALQLAKQVLHEKLNPVRKVRRRTSQSQIAFDVYMKLLKKNRPDYSSYFTNHVASSMHRYWPGLYPADYSYSKFEENWLKTYENEIYFTMHEANHHLTCLKNYVDIHKDTLLVVMSSMGQEAVDGEKLIERQLLMKDKKNFMKYLGLQEQDWSSERAMAPRYVFKIHNEKAINLLEKKLPSLMVNGKTIDYKFYSHGILRVKLGQANLFDNDIELKIEGKEPTLEALGIENALIEDSTASFAYHIPQGSLMIYNPKQNKATQKSKAQISTQEIAPSILKHFGLEVPSYMRGTSSKIFS